VAYNTPASRCSASSGKVPGGRENVYLPEQAVVERVIRENSLVNTYELSLVDVLANQRFRYQPGQFMMVSMPHLGEAPISFSSRPGEGGDCFSLTIRNSGRLTAAVQDLQPGDVLGVRGPYGKPFPLERLKGKKVVFVAGGIGLAPLRPVLELLLAEGDTGSDLSLFYGSRSPEDFCFARDFERWRQAGLDLRLTVDQADEKWGGAVGLVTALLQGFPLDQECLALVCGPGIMIRFVVKQLQEMGMKADNIITTLERHMKCGVGICGHCYTEGRLVCVDGPVFSAAELPEPENP